MLHEEPDATLAHVLTAPLVGAVVSEHGFGVQVCLVLHEPRVQSIAAPFR
jgi:hypothetical protein